MAGEVPGRQLGKPTPCPLIGDFYAPAEIRAFKAEWDDSALPSETESIQPVVPVLFSPFLVRFFGDGESSMLLGGFVVAVSANLRTSICPLRTRLSRQG